MALSGTRICIMQYAIHNIDLRRETANLTTNNFEVNTSARKFIYFSIFMVYYYYENYFANCLASYVVILLQKY